MIIAKIYKYVILKLEEIFFRGGFNMKKFISILLTGVMLAVPVYGQSYSQEDVISTAKEICNIGSYDNFNISSSQDSRGNITYSLDWNNDTEVMQQFPYQMRELYIATIYQKIK